MALEWAKEESYVQWGCKSGDRAQGVGPNSVAVCGEQLYLWGGNQQCALGSWHGSSAGSCGRDSEQENWRIGGTGETVNKSSSSYRLPRSYTRRPNSMKILIRHTKGSNVVAELKREMLAVLSDSCIRQWWSTSGAGARSWLLQKTAFAVTT